jgi:hypothetical protein
LFSIAVSTNRRFINKPVAFHHTFYLHCRVPTNHPLREHKKCDGLRVAGGPDVLSKSAVPSQAEIKHKSGVSMAWLTQDVRGPPKAQYWSTPKRPAYKSFCT